MEELNINELKSIEMNILNEFIRFCNLNNLKYVVYYGTLLGSVRHDGFIPWDDDIDVAMPREDYEKFLKLYKSDDFKLLDCFSNKYYYLPFAKLCDTKTYKREHIYQKVDVQMGVDLDIFPLDRFDDENIPLHFREKHSFLFRLIRYANTPTPKINSFKNLIRATVFTLLHGHGNSLCKKVDKILKKKSCANGKFMSPLTYPYFTIYGVNVFDFDIFENTIDHKFEDIYVKIPENYAKVLTVIYGDYMKLPPKEKQVTCHVYEAYRR